MSISMALVLTAANCWPVIPQTLTERVVAMEERLAREFAGHFGASATNGAQTPEEMAAVLATLEEETGQKSAILWVTPTQDFLSLVLLTASGEPVAVQVQEASKQKLMAVVSAFQRELQISPHFSQQQAARQLYDWIIGPHAEILEREGIDLLLFCLSDGVRGLPLAALFDGEQFLLEKYSLTRIPAFGLIDTDYQPLRPGRIVAMGASEFADQFPLPAVPLELASIVWALGDARPPGERWQGEIFLNQDFTVEQLQQALQQDSPAIVHLATHTFFRPGQPSNSYIEFWDSRLSLDEVNTIAWNAPALELLVLSACQTALGDGEAELGFAGLALEAGVKSVAASLWSVDDLATFLLMREFYQQLGKTSTKAEALRQAQLRMLRGEITIAPEDLPAGSLANVGRGSFSAPHYWAGFTMVSSPW